MRRLLRDLNPGDTATIVEVMGAGALRRRLLDMGITRGATVTLRKVAPLGDPLEVHLRGYELTLRRSEAEQIVVE